MKSYDLTEQAYRNGYEKGLMVALNMVRCRDCQYFRKHPTSDTCWLCTNEEWNTEYHPFTKPEGFCYLWERREHQ